MKANKSQACAVRSGFILTPQPQAQPKKPMRKFRPSILSLFTVKKAPVHELKWKLPEERLTAQLPDTAPIISVLRKRAAFLGGGEFIDTIYAKEFGQNVFAYFFLRTDKKTESEQLLFDGYMLEEEERLGMEVESGFRIKENLAQMGYEEAFARDITLWRFRYGIINATVYDVADFGAFIEVAVPATKFVKSREAMEKAAFLLFAKIGVKKEEIIPTDVATLQLVTLREEQEKQAQQPQK